MNLPLNRDGDEALREDQELSLGRETVRCLIDIQVQLNLEFR